MNSKSRQLDITISSASFQSKTVSISIQVATKGKDRGDGAVVKKEKTKLDGCFTPKRAGAETKDESQVPETKSAVQMIEDSEEYQALLRRLNYPA